MRMHVWRNLLARRNTKLVKRAEAPSSVNSTMGEFRSSVLFRPAWLITCSACLADHRVSAARYRDLSTAPV